MNSPLHGLGTFSNLRKAFISFMTEQCSVYAMLIFRPASNAQSAKLQVHSQKLRASCRETTLRHGGDAGLS